ncbi:hypothetical protein phiP47_006 [Plesiomonas phage phiP4-7]|nr:hypothetical protein phiP47_006 [Plesiomonas phage phiP4-7]
MTGFLYVIVMLSNIFMILLAIRKLNRSSGRDNRLIAATLMVGFALLVMHLTVTPHQFASLGEIRQSIIVCVQGAITMLITINLIRRF